MKYLLIIVGLFLCGCQNTTSNENTTNVNKITNLASNNQPTPSPTTAIPSNNGFGLTDDYFLAIQKFLLKYYKGFNLIGVDENCIAYSEVCTIHIGNNKIEKTIKVEIKKFFDKNGKEYTNVTELNLTDLVSKKIERTEEETKENVLAELPNSEE